MASSSLAEAVSPPDALQARAAELNLRFRGAAPEVVLAAVVAEHPGRVAMLSSFGAEAAVGLAVLAQVAPATPVLFLDTGLHFFQTLSYRRDLSRRLGLTDVRDLRAAPGDPRDPDGLLWKTDPDACCGIRKVEPLDRALKDFDVVVTGRKRFHGAGRLRLPLFEVIEGQLRLNLLVGLTPEEIARRFDAFDLPRHTLAEQGFTSIGCWPCTRPAQAGDETSRSGRWDGSDKVECGIHLPRAAAPAA